MKRLLKAIVGAVICVVVGVGVAHCVTHQDKVVDTWNKIFHNNDQNQEEKTDTKTDEIENTASITILSDGSTKLNK